MRFAVAAGSLLAAGCSILLSTAEPTQCSTNADCDGNVALRGRVCESGFCVVPRAPVTPIATDAGQGCVSTAQCTQANGNKASVCKTPGGPCVPWQTDECPKISGDWQNPDAIVIGDLQLQTILEADKSRPKVPYIDRIIRAIDLGLDEFSTAVPNGLLVGSTRRPLAVLHCDTAGEPTVARRVFDHVTDVVGAQAVIVGWDEDLIAIADQATTKHTTVVCSDCLGELPKGPIVWRTAPLLADDAPLVAARVADLEAQIKSRPSPPASVKVALLSEFGRGPDAFRAKLFDVLRFNAKTITQNGTDFRGFQTGDFRKEIIRHLDVANAIVEFAPDILVVAMATDFPTYYIPLVEAQWPAGKPKPSYVLTELSYDLAAFAPVVTNDDLRRRISGAHEHVTPELQANIDSYTIRYKQAWNAQAPGGNFAGYEAFWSTAYAIVAASAQPMAVLDGPHIATGFEHLVSGPSVDIGPGGVKAGLTFMLGAGSIDLRGLSSNLDWNVTTRALEGDVGMFCIGRDAGGNLVMRDDTGLRYSTKTGQITGTYACD